MRFIEIGAQGIFTYILNSTRYGKTAPEKEGYQFR